MRVEVWSDVVCPWCYIGKRRFETALAQLSKTTDTSSIQVVYRAYQLDPTAPPGTAQPVAQAYAKKFGGPERAREILDHVTGIAAADGITFNMDRALRANTLLAHRLLWYTAELDNAAGTSLQASLHERLLRAYFTEGENIGDNDVLIRCATQVGLSHDEVVRFLDSDEGRAEVMQELAQAAAHGITAVPTFVFDNTWSVPGAQDVTVFESILTRLLDESAPVSAAPGGMGRDDASNC